MKCCICRYCTPRRNFKRTDLEDILLHIVLANFDKVISEKRFGKYRVDAYLPQPYHIAFEADGEYWHTRPGAIAKDKSRDFYLLKRFKLPVVRFSQKELENIMAQHIKDVKEKSNDSK